MTMLYCKQTRATYQESSNKCFLLGWSLFHVWKSNTWKIAHCFFGEPKGAILWGYSISWASLLTTVQGRSCLIEKLCAEWGSINTSWHTDVYVKISTYTWSVKLQHNGIWGWGHLCLKWVGQLLQSELLYSGRYAQTLAHHVKACVHWTFFNKRLTY